MNLNTPLSRVLGLGSAKSGLHHWWLQRLTAIALVPLMLWLVCGLAQVAGGGYAAAREWVASPGTATLLVLLVVALFWHLKLGLQVIIEDYVHLKCAKVTSLVVLNFAVIAAAVATVLAILKISLGVA